MYGGRFLNGVSLSLRRCHNFAGPGEIILTVVPPTEPNNAQIIPRTQKVDPLAEHLDPNSCAEAWSNTLKTALDTFLKEGTSQLLYDLSGTWTEAGLTLYLMTVEDTKKNWYSLSKPYLKSKPTKEELESKLLQFLVTGTEGTWPG
eukprot:GHVU01089885.1.p1 GENE.GHVU01089885.1~~GHVU01089885.1.p1  ORF type:complete len:146 (-),score=7.66 GHVU01089885.1:143-580(-)